MTKVTISRERNLKTIVIDDKTWKHTCLSCGCNINDMQIVKDLNNGVGGFYTVYRCKCGKEVIRTI